MLEKIVTEAISELSDFIRSYNSVFMYLLARKKGESNLNQEKLLKSTIESSKKRISDLDKLFSRIYEDNIIGKLSDERYSRMANEYESEQKELAVKVAECEKQLLNYRSKLLI